MNTLVTASLEQAVNSLLVLDPEAGKQLSRLHGNIIAFDLEGIGLQLYLAPGPHRLQILTQLKGEPDCTLQGTPLAIAQMGNSRSSSKQIFSGDVKIKGNTELAHRFGKILGSLNVDWEEQLSRFSGDIVAHEVGNGVRRLNRWGRTTGTTLRSNLKEYLQEELGLLPVRVKIDGFASDVDGLRDDTERLQARVKRLQANLHDPKEGLGDRRKPR
ncbi:MAG: sterol-binding protein [Gammaproteobacteria bacterium]|nr:sterol-binding protein [Gammaproteobacteria bacterium]